MRDYDPTTGRYIEPDPLGLVDGASVYGYVRQNPGRWVDPWGYFTLNDARVSLANRGVSPRGSHESGLGRVPRYSDQQVFDEWLRLERTNTAWTDELLTCPCELDGTDTEQWQNPRYFPSGVPFHPGGTYDVRSILTPGGHGSQCIYDSSGNLVVVPPGAGSADYRGFAGLSDPFGAIQHYGHDVAPFNLADRLGRVNDYYDVRPVQ
jgi:hypothetical protein